MNTLFLSFLTMFIAELGDKTQLAVISLVMSGHKPFYVWLGATFAFCILNLLAVSLGTIVTKFIPHFYLKNISGIIFIIIGTLILFSK